MEKNICAINEQLDSKNLELNSLKDNSNIKEDQINNNKENYSIDNSKKSTLLKSYEKSNKKKHYKLKDLNLLNTKDEKQNQTDNPQIIKILNENIVSQNNQFDEYSIFLDKDYKTITLSNHKNKSNKNISFITKESKLINTIQLQDTIYNTEDNSNHTILHTVGIQCSQIPNREGNISKLKHMKTYNKNMDYYKYNYEINKKHMLKTQFNLNKKYENVNDNSKLNISQLLNMIPGREIEEQFGGKIKVYQDFIENNKIYTKEEMKLQEDLINKKNSLKLFAEVNFIDKNKLEKTKSEQEDEFDNINPYNHLRFEHKKPQDYILMVNKKTSLNQVETPKGFGLNLESIDNISKSRPSPNSNIFFKNKNYLDKNKFISEVSMHRIMKKDYFDNTSSVESKASTIFHKMAQEEINLKLEKQRKDIKNLLKSNNKNNLNNKNIIDKDYSNILSSNKSLLSKNKIEPKREQTDISFEKTRDFLKQNKSTKKLKETNNLESQNSDINSEKYSLKLVEESEISKVLPSIYSNRMSENKEQEMKNLNEINNPYKHSLNRRINNHGFEDKRINDFFNVQQSSRKNANLFDQKDNILEIDGYKMQNLNEKIYENKDILKRDFSSRYIDHMKNNIFNIANIEIFSKYSHNNNNKQIKPFTPENEKFQKHSHRLLNSNTIVIKEDINIEEKTKRSSIKNTSKKYLDLPDSSNINSTLNYYNNTCPTELNNSNTLISKENLDLNSSRLEKTEKIKNLNRIINMGKLQKLDDLKKQINSGYSNMNLLEGKLMDKINDSTQNFRNKLNKIQEKYYSTYKNEWQNFTHS